MHRSRVPRRRAHRRQRPSIGCPAPPTSHPAIGAGAERARCRAEWLLSAGMGIGGERLGARSPGSSALAAWSDAPLAYRLSAADRAAAGDLAVAREKYRCRRLVARNPTARCARRHSIAMQPQSAAEQLMRRRRKAGAHALILRDIRSTATRCAPCEVLRRHAAAPPTIPSARLSRRKARRRRAIGRGARRKEAEGAAPAAPPPRRARRRSFEIARTQAHVAAALEAFLALEASGWKGKRGTALCSTKVTPPSSVAPPRR